MSDLRHFHLHQHILIIFSDSIFFDMITVNTCCDQFDLR